MAAITSAATGVWSAGATWTGGAVPGEGDTVQICDTHTVTLDASVTVGADTTTPAIDILSGGILAWDNLGSDILTLKGDFYIRSGGTLNLNGTSTLANVLTVKLNYSATLANQKYVFRNYGTVSIQGFNKTREKDTVATIAASGQANVITANNNSAGWQAGDRVRITSITNTTDDKELKIIQSISGTTITLTTNLTKTYEVGAYVINLDKNIVFTVYNTSYYTRMKLETNSSTDIDWARFYYLSGAAQYNYGVIDSQSLAVTLDIDQTTFDTCGGNVLAITNLSNITFSNLIFYANTGRANIFTSPGASNITVDSSYWLNNVSDGMGYGGNGINLLVSNSFFEDNAGTTLYAEWGINNCIFKSNATAYAPSLNLTAIDSLFIFNTTGVSLGTVTKVTFTNCDFGTNSRGNTSRDVYINGFIVDAFFQSCQLKSTTPVEVGTGIKAGTKVRFEDCADYNAGHKAVLKYGTYERQSTIKYSNTSALLMNPTDANNPLIAEATVFAKNGETVAYSCYMRKSVAMAVLPYVQLSGAGITTSTATMTNSVDTWELMVVSGVATEDGFCKIGFVAQNASGSVYVDDDQDSFTYWYEGDLPRVLPKPSMTANDIWNIPKNQLTAEGSVGQHVKNIKNQRV